MAAPDRAAEGDDRQVVVPHGQRSLYVEVTSRCNSLCVHCPRTFQGLDWKTDVSPAQFRELIDQLPDLRRVVLHGLGEPLLNPRLFEIIALLKARGVHVTFNSNAISLGPRTRAPLVRSGLDEYRVSLDAATPATYTAIRGVNKLPTVLCNVAGLMETIRNMGSATPRVSLWFVTMRENLHELPELVRLAARLGVPEVYIQRLVYFGEGLAVESQSLYARLTEAQERLIEASETLGASLGVRFNASGRAAPRVSLGAAVGLGGDRPWRSCRRPWELSYITAEGEVLPCCFVPFVTDAQWEEYVLGNVNEQSLAEIWNGPRYREFRRRFLSDTPPEVCAGCNVRWSV
jgi:radical SAM protein with 4Fe4S-binding SPASM domain